MATSAPASVLAAARGGDEHAYRALVAPHERELHAHCYRMLGSVHDAEDALQEALLRAWRALPRFDGRSSLRTWLYRIATNTALDALKGRGRRALPIDLGPAAGADERPGRPLVETTWIEPYPDAGLPGEEEAAGPQARVEQRESVELAFVAALQHLPGNQRAALLLCEVLGFSAQEAADGLQTSVASLTSALQRARRSLEERRPERSQQATLRALGDARLREVVTGYADAMARGDVDAVLALVGEDASWSMPPLATWWRGRADLRAFLEHGPLSGAWTWRHVIASASGQPAVGAYTWHEDEARFRPFALDVLTLASAGPPIAAVTSFIARQGDGLSPSATAVFPDQAPDARLVGTLFTAFGLPERLER